MTTNNPLLYAIDFTTLYIPSVAAADVESLRQDGFGLGVMGFDSSQQSSDVRNAFVQDTWLWDAYRFITWAAAPEPQLADVRQGIVQQVPLMPLPGFLWLDIEENSGGLAGPPGGIAAAQAALSHLMDVVESYDITPTSLVMPGFYTRRNYFDQWFGTNYTEPGDRGWKLWSVTENGIQDPNLFTGYGGMSVEGVQYQWNVAAPIGQVDVSAFLPRGQAAQTPPDDGIQPQSALARLNTAIPILQGAVADLTPASAVVRSRR